MCVDRASLQQMLGHGLSLAEIGRRFGVHEATVAYWVSKHGLEAVNRAEHARRGGLTLAQLEPLVMAGMSVARIAKDVDRGKATVRYWLKRHGLKTGNGRGRRPSDEARDAKHGGRRTAQMICRRHGEAAYVLDGRGYYRCRRCRAEAVTRRRRRIKATLVREAGGACCLCGYCANMRALHFHHRDPAEKRLELNAKGIALSLETLRVEAQKCVLLCSNCHAEVEDGVASLAESDTRSRTMNHAVSEVSPGWLGPG